uniref:Transmembrane protein 138 n=1 Tax=Alexandrium andersonii TaxID=327968 RepID=A0A7S2HM74_9DINO|mmetsp:Transcript_72791/g.162973  ORF Transcript_72791/g.162973 Transcript_72791/m.162973 type:complete len:182 (+) Transcript_72791:127-672(+)
MANDVPADSVSPHLFAMKLNAMLVLVIIDCLCNGFADHLWDPSQAEINIALCVTPIVLHLLNVLLFFMLLWHTFLLRSGLLLELWSEFRGVFLFSTLRFGVLLGCRIPRLIAALEYYKPGEYWEDPFSQAMFFAHNIVTVIYDSWLLRRSYALARVRYYKPQIWLKHRRERGKGSTLSGRP